MNTMNNNYFFRRRQHRKICSKTLNILHRMLVVISVYLIFGLLFQYVYASTKSNNMNDPYQSLHGAVWLLSDDGNYIEALQMQTDVNYTVTANIDQDQYQMFPRIIPDLYAGEYRRFVRS